VAQRDVGGRARLHAEADAHDLGAHLVERGGFGVQRRQRRHVQGGQPAVELVPGQDGLVAPIAGGLFHRGRGAICPTFRRLGEQVGGVRVTGLLARGGGGLLGHRLSR